MKRPSFLAYVDFASTDPNATGEFYEAVLGWKHDIQEAGIYHRMIPGGSFDGADGQPSGIRHLHMGIFNVANVRPHPDPAGVEPRFIAKEGRRARIWVEISPDDTHQRIMTEATDRGAITLWRDHIFTRFGGLTDAFRDPWGNEVIIWTEEIDKYERPGIFTKEPIEALLPPA